MGPWIIFIGIVHLAVVIRIIFRNALLFTLIWQPLIVIITVAVGHTLGLPLGHPLNEVLGGVEHAHGLLTTLVAPLGLLVLLQGAFLTEVVLTPSDHWVNKHLAADGALDREVIIVRVYHVLVIIALLATLPVPLLSLPLLPLPVASLACSQPCRA